MFITSLNLYDYSEQNNREMGVMVTKQNDAEVYAEAVREVKMMISLATRPSFNMQAVEQTTKKTEKGKSVWNRDLSEIFSSLFGNKGGFCIGCRAKIDLDEYRPYCPECYGMGTK